MARFRCWSGTRDVGGIEHQGAAGRSTANISPLDTTEECSCISVVAQPQTRPWAAALDDLPGKPCRRAAPGDFSDCGGAPATVAAGYSERPETTWPESICRGGLPMSSTGCGAERRGCRADAFRLYPGAKRTVRVHSLTITVVLLAATSAAGGRGQDLFTDDDRFYLAPIIGASWATVVNDEYQPVNTPIQTAGNLFSAGGAAGIAFDRDSGQARLEFEGRYRDSYSVASTRFVGPIPVTADVQLVDNWSTLVNLWRDFSITNRLGLYGGGGIGAGGYGLNTTVALADLPPIAQGSSRHAAFAWQVGTGLLYALNDRITLDLGYRFYSVGLGTTTIRPTGLIPPVIVPPDASLPISTGFASHELLLNIRIYEPFRRWR